MTDFRDHVRRAASLVGSQARLAELMGCSQQTVSRLVTEAEDISAEHAIKIERATGGAITREQLRPDLFPPAETLRQGVG